MPTQTAAGGAPSKKKKAAASGVSGVHNSSGTESADGEELDLVVGAELALHTLSRRTASSLSHDLGGSSP